MQQVSFELFTDYINRMGHSGPSQQNHGHIIAGCKGLCPILSLMEHLLSIHPPTQRWKCSMLSMWRRMKQKINSVLLICLLMPAAHATASSPLPTNLGTSSSSSVVSSISLPDLSTSLSSGGTRPLPSSSLPPSVHPWAAQQSNTSMGSVSSITTGTLSETGQKCKRDARSMSGMQPPNSKWSSSKTNDLNPVIISSALNSTLNRMANVMERSLDVTAATITHSAPPATAPFYHYFSRICISDRDRNPWLSNQNHIS